MHPEARAQLRLARRSAGLSLRELGSRIGVSASLLSQIERGNSEPSVASLYALVKELGLSLDALAGSSGSPGRKQPAGPVDPQPDPRLNQLPVIRPDQRAHLDMTWGVHWEQLTHGADPVADALLVTYEPGSRSSSDGTLMTHSGVEYAYLMEGELTLHLGFQRIVIHAGDSLRFESSQPHMYQNQGDRIARGVWFVVGRTGSAVARADGGSDAETQPPTSVVDVLRSFDQTAPTAPKLVAARDPRSFRVRSG